MIAIIVIVFQLTFCEASFNQWEMEISTKQLLTFIVSFSELTFSSNNNLWHERFKSRCNGTLVFRITET